MLAMSQNPEPLLRAAGFFLLTGGALMLLMLMVGVLLMTLVFAPGLAARGAVSVREHNVLSFLTGVVVFAVFALLGRIGQNVPPVGVGALGGFTILLLLGLTGLSEDFGRRLAWMAGTERSRAAHVLMGWPTLAAAICVPVVGWFIVLPYVVLSALGSVPLGLFRRERKPSSCSP
ncbi:MAG: hypothetical protein HYY16_15525 [Planctomycetes bacterium]|nr:hypothetical protein [Planctomycetota bacterium]